MLDRDTIHNVVLESLASLNADRASNDKITISDDTPLTGDESEIDSLSFVAFTTELEDRLRELTGTDLAGVAARLWSDPTATRDPRTLTDTLVTLFST